MKIIITGANGFLGKHITAHFADDELIRLGRTEGDIIADLANQVPELPYADLVIHAAGKAHSVPRNAEEVRQFYAVNAEGTRNLLKGLEAANQLPGAFVLISTIAVYGVDTGKLITEEHPLNATDPYGKSKIEAENAVADWCLRLNIPFTILRLPLIAGKQPPGNLNSMIRGIRKGYYFNIAKGKARRSMVMASSVAEAILPAVGAGGIFNFTDGYHPSFGELSELMARQLGKSRPLSIPERLAHLIAIVGSFTGNLSPLNKKNYKKMINDLTFDDSKARSSFKWNPVRVIDEFKLN